MYMHTFWRQKSLDGYLGVPYIIFLGRFPWAALFFSYEHLRSSYHSVVDAPLEISIS